jgi:glycosyltransferase involved in cell wall biosynthesis
VLSPADKAEFEHFLPKLKGRVRVVKNVISETFLNAKRQESEKPLVLFASRFVKEKGPFYLLDAVPSIVEHIPNARFIFLGDGPDAADFDAAVSHRRMSTFVQRLGNVGQHEVASWLSRSWVFVFPTLFPEGMPMALAEAMATGSPIVTTRIRFALSYMAEHVNCLYCEPTNSESIAQRVTMLLADPAMRRRMSHANRSLALQFRSDDVARQFVQLYEQLSAAREEARSSTNYESLVNKG